MYNVSKVIDDKPPRIIPPDPYSLPTLQLSGVQAFTATGIQDMYAILGAFGIGFDLGLAAGIVVTTNCGINQVRAYICVCVCTRMPAADAKPFPIPFKHVKRNIHVRTPTQFLGLIYAGMLGGFACNLAGLYIAEHSPFISNVGQGAEAGGVRGFEKRREEKRRAGRQFIIWGIPPFPSLIHTLHYPNTHTHTQGGYVYTAAGLNSFHFCPVYVTAGTWAAFMAGAYVGLPGTQKNWREQGGTE